MKLSEVASQLRILADALDKAPTADVHAYLSLNTACDKTTFLALANLWPRPFKKKVDFADTAYSDFTIEHGFMRLTIAQSSLCRLIKPAQAAVYDCGDPLLSDADINSLEDAHASGD